jgi:hypothetical protein
LLFFVWVVGCFVCWVVWFGLFLLCWVVWLVVGVVFVCFF